MAREAQIDRLLIFAGVAYILWKTDLLLWAVVLACAVWTGLLVFGVVAGLYYWLIEPPLSWLARRVRVALLRYRAKA